jgi:Kef-type K+ transport system membrane component KefB
MHYDPLSSVLLALIVVLSSAKLGSELFERLGLPSVLGELLLGILLGNLVIINPHWDFFGALRTEHITQNWALMIDDLARLGVILLLFEVGLETTVADMAKVGLSSLLVAVVGVIAPFALGFGVSWLLIKDLPVSLASALPSDFGIENVHIFIGAILCATSVGITARVFKDLGKLQTKEAKIVLGAAIIDDVLGLIILAIVAGIVTASINGTKVSLISLVRIALVALGFLTAAIFIGTKLVPRIMNVLAKMRTEGVIVTSSLIFCFLLSWLANIAGLATIVGAFAAGLLLEVVHFKKFKEKVALHQLIRPISTLFVPIFFVLMGIQVRLESFSNFKILGLALALTLAAIVGKQVCGLAIVGKKLDRISIGIGMIPRGEVGLIFAGIGKSLGVLDNATFSAIVIMVVLTTLITPPALKLSLSRWARRHTSD